MIKLILTLMKLKRLFQITIILMKYAFQELTDNSIIIFKSRRSRSKKKVVSTQQRIRQTIEELGPTYVKFGQILADRSDVVSEKFRIELKKLQSKVKPFDTDVAINIIEQSLGDTIDSLFTKFNYYPLAAASIGQVYLAVLKDGTKVVVKVQRPFIENKIKMDTYWMKFLAKRLARTYPELAAINVVGLIDEFSQNILKEIDYDNEASNMNVFFNMFEDSTSIKIPKVYDEYTSRRVLVMEYIDGVTPGDREYIMSLGFDTEKIVENGTKAIFKTIFEYGVFHADPHPGNLFILENNRLAFIDFGMIGMLRPREMNFLADFIIGYVKKDSVTIAKSLLELCELKYYDKRDELIFTINQIMIRNFASNTIELEKFSAIMQSSIDVLVKFNLQIPTGIFMLVKTIATFEKFAANMAPSLDLSPFVLPYAEEMIKRNKSTDRLFNDFRKTLDDYMNLFKSFPNSVNEILMKLKQGEIRHDVMFSDYKAFVKMTRQVSLRIAYTILLIGLFIGSIIMVIWYSEHKFGFIVLYLSSFLIAFLLIRWLFMGRRF